MDERLEGKRVLVTQASHFMGAALCEVLAEQGAEVVASDEPLSAPTRPSAWCMPPPASMCWWPISVSLRRARWPAR
jgi:nucleoside-diphosphate-sugar epimerase